MSSEVRPGLLRRLFRRLLSAVFALVLLLVLLIGFWFVYSGAVYNRFVRLPRMEKDIATLAKQVTPVSLDDGWNEYRCVMHTHSHFSHDSLVPFEDILQAGKERGIDAFFLTDHCVNKKADFSIQWKGLHDGILFVRGYEMDYGFLLWNMPDDVTVPCMLEAKEIAQMSEEKKGLLFYAHSEEPRNWDFPEYKGMEIYNIHTDLKDESIPMLLPNLLLCYKRFPELILRIIFDRHPDIIAHWDELNQTRRVTGFGANDSHQNNGIRIIYNQDGEFELWEAGPKPHGKFPAFLTPLLKWYYQPKAPGETVLNFYIDPYKNSINFDNTHVLAKELTIDSLIDSLIQGRAFVAFNSLAPAKGFVYFAEDGKHKTVMGEDALYTTSIKLRAEAPLPAKYTVVKDGKPIHTFEGKILDYTPPEPGQYRLELELLIAGEWTPWIYTNPIRLNAK